MSAPQWQRWTVTVPAGRHRTMLNTGDVAFDAYIPNVYSDEAMMRTLVERAGFRAVMEYADPPARAMTRAEAELQADTTGKPVEWQGQTISPDYRPGHTRHPEIRGHI